MFGTKSHLWKGAIALIAINALLYGRHEVVSKVEFDAAFKGDAQKKLTQARRKALKAGGRPKSPAYTPSAKGALT